MATNQLRLSTAAIALICATCFGSSIVHSQLLVDAPTPVQQAAIDANPFFYETNWVLSADPDVRSCRKGGIFRCFANGYCASVSETSHSVLNATDGYSLKALEIGNDAVSLRRFESMNVGEFNASGGIFPLVVPEIWKLPNEVVFLNIDMDLIPRNDHEVTGVRLGSYFLDHIGAINDQEGLSDLEFYACAAEIHTDYEARQCSYLVGENHCNTPPGMTFSESAADMARQYTQTYEVFAEVTAAQQEILDAINSINVTFTDIVADTGISEQDLYDFAQIHCHSCHDFRKQVDFFSHALSLAQSGQGRWLDIHHEAVSFKNSYEGQLAAIDAFLLGDLTDHAVSLKLLKAEIEAQEQAEQQAAEAAAEAEAERLAQNAENRGELEAQYRAELEAFYNDPIRFLQYSYHNWMITQACHTAREGYVLQYVNAADLERARENIIAIEASVLGQYSDLDTQRIWDAAFADFGRFANSPIGIRFEVGLTEELYVEDWFRGPTGGERHANFQNRIRNSNNVESAEATCRWPLGDLNSDAARLRAAQGESAPAKDF